MRCNRRKPASLDLTDAGNVVPARRHMTDPLPATDRDHRHVAPPTDHPYFRVRPHDPDR
ncbi:hypothetical protein [Streptomyces sannanensis]